MVLRNINLLEELETKFHNSMETGNSYSFQTNQICTRRVGADVLFESNFVESFFL